MLKCLFLILVLISGTSCASLLVSKKLFNKQFQARKCSTVINDFVQSFYEAQSNYLLADIFHYTRDPNFNQRRNVLTLKSRKNCDLAASIIICEAAKKSPVVKEILSALPYLNGAVPELNSLPEYFNANFCKMSGPRPFSHFNDDAEASISFGLIKVAASSKRYVRIEVCPEAQEELHQLIPALKKLKIDFASCDNILQPLTQSLHTVTNSIERRDGHLRIALKYNGFQDTNLLFSDASGKITWKAFCRAANLSDLECKNLGTFLRVSL